MTLQRRVFFPGIPRFFPVGCSFRKNPRFFIRPDKYFYAYYFIMEMEYLVIYTIVSLILSAVIAENIGKRKEIGFTGTLLLGILLTPLVALIGALVSAPLDKQHTNPVQSSTPTPGNNISIADELQKLANLREKGMLTEQEYQRLKDRIIH
jgi:uncharacterized membrane protein YcgQ (UPF0703/DUF1980 family)